MGLLLLIPVLTGTMVGKPHLVKHSWWRGPLLASGAVAGGALMLVGSFVPWVDFSIELRRSDGLISAALGIVATAIGFALLRNESRLGSSALALGGVLVCLAVTDLQGRLGSISLRAMGIGLWVMGAGALLTGVTGLAGLRTGDSLPPVAPTVASTDRNSAAGESPRW
jgi:hypothetical protein